MTGCSSHRVEQGVEQKPRLKCKSIKFTTSARSSKQHLCVVDRYHFYTE